MNSLERFNYLGYYFLDRSRNRIRL
jgi:chromosome segregation ATPase